MAWAHVPRALCGHQQVCSDLRPLCRKRDDVQLLPAASGAPPFALVIRIGGLLVRARIAHVVAPASALISYGSFCAGLLHALLSLAGDACPRMRTRLITRTTAAAYLGDKRSRALCTGRDMRSFKVWLVACGVWPRVVGFVVLSV